MILLDETMSALDRETERNIQTSLLQVCEGRITIILTHRISSIINTHQVMVLMVPFRIHVHTHHRDILGQIHVCVCKLLVSSDRGVVAGDEVSRGSIGVITRGSVCKGVSRHGH